MEARTNWVLLGIAIALTAYAWFFEAGSTVWSQRGRLYPDLDPNEIVELRLERPSAVKDAAIGVDARPILLQKEGSPPEWWIAEPIHAEAFHPKVQTIAFDLADLMRIADVIPDKGSDPFQKGVDFAVAFKTRDGRSFGLELGAEHPDPKLDLVYARETRPGSMPFVIRREFRKSLLVSLNDLRSRALLAVAPPDVARLEVTGDPQFGKVVARVGSTDRWRLKEPIDAAADRQLVENLLLDLNSWTLSAFFNDAATDADLEACGLRKPRATVRLERRDGFAVALEIGGVASTAPNGMDAEVFVHPVGRPFVYKALVEPLALLLKSHEEIRARYVFDFGLEDVAEIHYESPQTNMTLRRVQEKEKEKDGRGYSWQVLDKAGNLLFPGDRADIDAAVLWHRTLTIQQFRKERLESPARKLRFRTSGNRDLELVLGDLSKNPDHQGLHMYPAAVEGEPGSYLVSTQLPETLDQGPIFMRARDISSLDPARVREIRILDGAMEWYLAQVQPGDPWMLDTRNPPLAGKDVDTALVNKLLIALHRDSFRVERYEPAATDLAGSELELQAPKRAIMLERIEGDEPVSFRKLVLGVRVGQTGEALGRVDIAGLPPFVLKKEVEEAFGTLVQHLHEVTGK